MTGTEANELIERWAGDTAAKRLHSSSEVQTRLFDLWGQLHDLPVGRTVEQWLTLTVERELFTAEELDELFGELRAGLPAGSDN